VNVVDIHQKDATATVAQSITWASSKQAYYTARLMVDKDLVDDFYRAYAYFRWADDMVDEPTANDVPCQSNEEVISFVQRQRGLIDRFYRNERPDDLAPEEEVVADLISHDRGESSGLQSFIRNMLAIIEFDAHRRGKLVGQQELIWYSRRVAQSVTDGIQYFVGNGHPYPDADGRYSAALGAHITHLLRDTLPDTADGFINIPREYLKAIDIRPEDVDSRPYRAWVRERVEQARQQFRVGKCYLDQLDVLRCKIVGHWYCARFERVLETIEQDDYYLRRHYEESRNLSAWLKIAWLGFTVTLRHIISRRWPVKSRFRGAHKGDL
jgi:phytoene/squalene synthetase